MAPRRLIICEELKNLGRNSGTTLALFGDKKEGPQWRMSINFGMFNQRFRELLIGMAGMVSQSSNGHPLT